LSARVQAAHKFDDYLDIGIIQHGAGIRR
jgi:hypothetical protein